MSVMNLTRFEKQIENISIRSEISQNPLPIPRYGYFQVSGVLFEFLTVLFFQSLKIDDLVPLSSCSVAHSTQEYFQYKESFINFSDLFIHAYTAIITKLITYLWCQTD